jgi:hypothetical protein
MCAEEVKAAALVCRFCGHEFDAAAAADVSRKNSASRVSTTAEAHSRASSAPEVQGPPERRPTPVHPKPSGAPPETLTRLLRDSEELLVWSPCTVAATEGWIAVTNARIVFAGADRSVRDHAINVPRKVKFQGSVLDVEIGDTWHLEAIEPDGAGDRCHGRAEARLGGYGLRDAAHPSRAAQAHRR